MRPHAAVYTNMSVLGKKTFLSADMWKCTKDSGGCKDGLDIPLQKSGMCKITVLH